MYIHSRSLAFARRILLTLTVLFCVASFAQTAQPLPLRETVKQSLIRQPLYFEPATDGAMIRRSPAGTMRLGVGGRAQFAAPGKPDISMVLDGANTTANPAGEETLPGRSNYLLGNNPARWRTGISQFSRIRVPAVYPGIDLVFYGNGNQLEHDYLLAPHADPALIRMQFQGAAAITDDSTGDLILCQTATTGVRNEALRLLKPVAYQRAADGAVTPVPVSYRALADGSYGFTLGAYDPLQAVVIDPVILYGSYFGGKYSDSIVDLKVGTDGSFYLLLTTDSTDLKTVGATPGACIGLCGAANADDGSNSQPDMYLAKLDSTAQTLLFATYLGGSSSDQAYNLALDTDGSIYVSGTSRSMDFPIVNGYPGGGPTLGGSHPPGTLTKLSADGSTILYSTFIGYGKPSVSYNPPVMVTASQGIVYLIGIAKVSSDADFIWKTNPLFTTGNDFIAKLDTTKIGTASVVYATQVGGSSNAQLSSLALDSKGDVWLYGQTSDATFPAATAGALQPQCKSNPCSASFLMEIDPTGTSVLYATYLGGSTPGASTTSRDILIDPADNVYVSGYTSQGDFPTMNGAYLTINGSSAGYVSKLTPDGKTLLYSTFMPVSVEIAVSTGGKLAFTGIAGSGFPVKNNLQTTPLAANDYDAVFGAIDTTKSFDDSLLIASYLGTNTGFTQPQRVYLASTGQILIVGQTSATDLPIAHAYQATPGGGIYDGFLAIIQPNSSLTLTPSSLAFPATSVGSTSAIMTATLSNATAQSISLQQGSLTDSKDFTQTDNCNGVVAPMGSCTVSFTFTPQSAGSLTSTYSTADLNNQTAKLTVALSGMAAAPVVTVSPTTLDFGSVTAGTTSATQSVTLTNGSNSALPVTGATVTGTGFALTNNGCGSLVPANGACQYAMTVSPTTIGPLTGSLTITDSIGSQTVQLTATGTPPKGSETLSPAIVNFGNVYVGGTTTQVVTFTNNGPGSVTFSAATIYPPAFKIVTTNCTPQVAAGVSCTYTLSYTPFGVGTIQGTFTITDGSSNPSVVLSGTGIQPPTGDNVFLLPGSVNFQNVVLGQGTSSSPDQVLTLANQTSQTVEVQDKNYLFVGTGSSLFTDVVGQPFFCPTSMTSLGSIVLAPYTTCTLDVIFNYTGNAAADTTYNAQFQVDWNYAGDTQLHYLATAVTANTLSPATPVVTPTSIQFPATANGTSSPAQVVTVSNAGDQPLTFNGASFNGTNAAAFTQTNNCPATLSKGNTCQISVIFAPGATGTSFTANLDVSLNTGDVNVTLNGGSSPADFVLSTTTSFQFAPNPSWPINITPLTASIGFNQPVTFSVSGLDPSYGTPVFTPSTVTPGGGTASTTLTLTPPVSAAFNQKPYIATAILPAFACCIPLFFGLRKKLKNSRIRIAAILLAFALATSGLSGCGKDRPQVDFTVIATSGSISHNLVLTLQP